MSTELEEQAAEQDVISSLDGGNGGYENIDGGGELEGTTDPNDTTVPADEDIEDEDIEKGSHSLDPKNSAQGAIGDCYLLSAIQSITLSDPEHVREHVTEVSPGVYHVTRYDENGDPVVYEVTGVHDRGVRSTGVSKQCIASMNRPINSISTTVAKT